jgi:hypothetical protein
MVSDSSRLRSRLAVYGVMPRFRGAISLVRRGELFAENFARMNRRQFVRAGIKPAAMTGFF